MLKICLLCLLATFAGAAQAAESPQASATTGTEPVDGTELRTDAPSAAQLKEMALWPEVPIRALLAGEASPPASSPGPSGEPAPPIDLLFVLQAANATFLPGPDGELIGGAVRLGGVQETIVSFADRPYRTMDAIPTGTFFSYPLVLDFFAGDNPPNAIIAGELPDDIAAQLSQREGTSRVIPYRRLLGSVLGAATYDAEANTIEFNLPAGADIFLSLIHI